MKFVNTNRTDNGEGKPLCTCVFTSGRDFTFTSKNTITDVEGRRLRE